VSAHAATADTLSLLATPLASQLAPVTPEAIERWHDFYLLAGTAAVTLVGLLFVALSFHLETLLQAEKAHLLATARMAFTSFLYVMLLSLAFLSPGLHPRMLGMFLLVFSVVLLGYAIWILIGRRGRTDPHERFLRRRFTSTGFVAGVAIVTAWQVLRAPRTVLLVNMAFIVAIMLINAATISWDLLVQVGRLKLRQEARHGG
jgi:hypothetical protein